MPCSHSNRLYYVSEARNTFFGSTTLMSSGSFLAIVLLPILGAMYVLCALIAYRRSKYDQAA